ncbi:MAG: hypothetical protein AAF604_00420 [Acidobacteriota bacterium]
MSATFFATAFLLLGAGGAAVLLRRRDPLSGQVLLLGGHLLLLTYLELLVPSRRPFLSLVLVAIALVQGVLAIRLSRAVRRRPTSTTRSQP